MKIHMNIYKDNIKIIKNMLDVEEKWLIQERKSPSIQCWDVMLTYKRATFFCQHKEAEHVRVLLIGGI